MSGFIVASVNKKSLKKVNKINNDIIKYTSVISDSEGGIEEEFIKQFPDHQFILAMPIADIKKQINFIDSLI